MTRTLFAALATLAFAACLDFDARYATQLERFDGGLAGSDGGSGPADAGPADAGAVDAGPALPGCDASLCEVGYWTSSSVKEVVGLVASTVSDVAVVGDDYRGSSVYKCDLVTLLADGGVSAVEIATGQNSCGRASGRPGNFWVHNVNTTFHVVDGTVQSTTSDDCQGGTAYWYSVQALSDDEALFAGWDLTLCRVNGAGGETLLSVAPERSSTGYVLYPEGVYQTPSGTIFMATSDGTVRRPDAGLASPQFEYDGQYNGLHDLAGISDADVWTVGDQGTVARLNSTGQFEAVFDAGVSLYTVAVVGPADVWVGGHGRVVWHYDGQWHRITLPFLAADGAVFAIAAGKDYVHFGGQQTYGVGFVLSYQRGR